jgi:hypothetical protein
MDLHRYAALRRQWRRSPPLQTMVQAYLGIEGEDPPPVAGPEPVQDEEAALRSFMSNFAAAGGRLH